MSSVIEVKTFANLRSLYPSDHSFQIIDGETVTDIMARMNIPTEKVTIIFINNVHRELHSRLFGGDVLGLFPPIGGG